MPPHEQDPHADELPLSLLMLIAHRSAENRIHAAVRTAGFDSMTHAQGRLLAGMEPGGSRISLLAERAQITKQTATALIDRLEAAGYVTRVPDPSDGRARIVTFTDRAWAMVPVARAEEQRIEAEWRAHLGGASMDALRSALETLRAITDPYLADEPGR